MICVLYNNSLYAHIGILKLNISIITYRLIVLSKPITCNRIKKRNSSIFGWLINLLSSVAFAFLPCVLTKAYNSGYDKMPSVPVCICTIHHHNGSIIKFSDEPISLLMIADTADYCLTWVVVLLCCIG